MSDRGVFLLGSARASRAGDGALAIANFSETKQKDCFGEGAEGFDQVAAATAPQ
jgi:hypothetical protein